MGAPIVYGDWKAERQPELPKRTHREATPASSAELTQLTKTQKQTHSSHPTNDAKLQKQSQIIEENQGSCR
jgi:hypothetical protein